MRLLVSLAASLYGLQLRTRPMERPIDRPGSDQRGSQPRGELPQPRIALRLRRQQRAKWSSGVSGFARLPGLDCTSTRSCRYGPGARWTTTTTTTRDVSQRLRPRPPRQGDNTAAGEGVETNRRFVSARIGVGKAANRFNDNAL